jgi:hypothetical protein
VIFDAASPVASTPTVQIASTPIAPVA